MELLGSRTDVDQDHCTETQQAFDVLLRIRFAQRYRHLHPVAADMTKIKQWLLEEPQFILDEVLTA